MNRINKILNSVTFRRILVIFVVGLISRTLVNYVFEINVFKNYSTNISLIYYGFMACFSAMVHELPLGVSINDFNKFEKVSKDLTFLSRDGSTLSNDKNSSSGVRGLYGNKVANLNHKPSAGLSALYNPKYNNTSDIVDYPGFGRKCKGKFL